jgi:hypothetical protein
VQQQLECRSQDRQTDRLLRRAPRSLACSCDGGGTRCARAAARSGARSEWRSGALSPELISTFAAAARWLSTRAARSRARSRYETPANKQQQPACGLEQ